MKNKKLIIILPIFILISAIVLYLVRGSFAIPTNASIRIECDSNTLTAGQSTNCRVIGSGNSVGVVGFNYSNTPGITISDVSVDTGNWSDGSSGNRILVWRSTTLNGNFRIISFKVTASSSAGTTSSISLSNVEFSDDQDVDVAGTTYNITVKAPDPSPDPGPGPSPYQPSTNNYLSGLSLSTGGIGFNRNKTSYDVTVGSNVSSVKVNASLEDGRASYVAGYNPRTVKLSYGKNVVKIIAVSESGSSRTYTINITRQSKSGGSGNSNSSNGSNNGGKSSVEKSSDNKLKTLYLSDGLLSFKSDKLSYDVKVPYKVKKVTIKGEPSSDKAKVKGLGEKELKVGLNTFEIVVTAENGDEKVYTIRITRQDRETSKNLDSNNYLKDLSIVGYEINFNKDTLRYEINRDGRSKLEIKARTESKKAKVTIMGNENLENGDEVKVVVTAEDGSNRVYTIVVKDSNHLLFTAVGIFLIGALSMAVVIAYKRKNTPEEDV